MADKTPAECYCEAHGVEFRYDRGEFMLYATDEEGFDLARLACGPEYLEGGPAAEAERAKLRLLLYAGPRCEGAEGELLDG